MMFLSVILNSQFTLTAFVILMGFNLCWIWAESEIKLEVLCHSRTYLLRHVCLIGFTVGAGNIYSTGSLPCKQQHGNAVVVLRSSASNSRKSEGDRDTESITLDQFLDECNKSPKSRVCVDSLIAEFFENKKCCACHGTLSFMFTIQFLSRSWTDT